MGINEYGFIRVAAVAPSLKVGDVNYNTEQIISCIAKLKRGSCQIALFPELCVTAYSCGDLFFQEVLIKNSFRATEEIASHCWGITLIVGLPVKLNGRLYNCAAVLCEGKIKGMVPKAHLPNRAEFYEERYFTAGDSSIKEENFGVDIFFGTPQIKFGIEICESLWAPMPPSGPMAVAGAQIIFNPSASNALVAKAEYRKELVKQQSARTNTAYVYASAGPGESTTDLLYSGHLLICENGSVIAEEASPSFDTQYIIADVDVGKLDGERLRNSSFAKAKQSDFRMISVPFPAISTNTLLRSPNPYPFIPSNKADETKRCKEIFTIQSMALEKRLRKTGITKVTLGLSGGLDSTLAVLVVVEAFKRMGLDLKGIITVTMPGMGTTTRTKGNAEKLAEALGTTLMTIPIRDAVMQHFMDIGQNPKTHNITYQNCQARERTQILMDLANKVGGFVVGTGDLSESALGWCSFNGDHMSMYNVNCSIPKTLVKYIVSWYMSDTMSGPLKEVLKDILNTPISPELLPPNKKGEISQVTEDDIGPYELHDFFLFNFMRYGFSPDKILFLAETAFKTKYTKTVIKGWLRVFLKAFFANQFKRSCVPDGPKVGSVALSPRGDWRMPSDAEVTTWMKVLDD